MRLASFLPMLLLAFSIPVAAQNCNISDLTAQVVQVNPLDCTFFVALEFQHSGPGNQCTVTGNGTNYGMFPYGQLPIVLGPFNGNPNNPTVLEFVVQDVLFPDCHDAVVVDFPPCGNGGLCDITNLAVASTDVARWLRESPDIEVAPHWDRPADGLEYPSRSRERT